MASFILSWAPTAVDVTNQVIQYKKRSDSSYTDYGTVSPSTSTFVVNGLLDNTIYDFRTACHCADGTTIYYTNIASAIKILCPILGITSSGAEIDYTFTPYSSTDVVKYVVQLYKNGVLYISQSYSAPFVGPISSSFNGLDYAQNYQLQIVGSTASNEFINGCGLSEIIVPVCIPVQDIIATVS